MEETDLLQKELEGFKAEQERVRALVGRIGGRTSLRQDMALNVVFLLVVVTVFLFDVLRGIFGITVPGLPLALMEEAAVLLISLKIIWMIHKQTKIDHFQFWILTSIEFQLAEVAKRVKELEAKIGGAKAGGA
jgi:hypothetical protein